MGIQADFSDEEESDSDSSFSDNDLILSASTSTTDHTASNITTTQDKKEADESYGEKSR